LNLLSRKEGPSSRTITVEDFLSRSYWTHTDGRHIMVASLLLSTD